MVCQYLGGQDVVLTDSFPFSRLLRNHWKTRVLRGPESTRPELIELRRTSCICRTLMLCMDSFSYWATRVNTVPKPSWVSKSNIYVLSHVTHWINEDFSQMHMLDTFKAWHDSKNVASKCFENICDPLGHDWLFGFPLSFIFIFSWNDLFGIFSNRPE